MDVSFKKNGLHLTEIARIFLRTIYLRKRKIVGDSVCNLAYNISKKNLSTL